MSKWTIHQANVGLDVAYKPITIQFGDSGRAVRVSDESDDTDMAHARLIAAAPEMAELLPTAVNSGKVSGEWLADAQALLARLEAE